MLYLDTSSPACIPETPLSHVPKSPAISKHTSTHSHQENDIADFSASGSRLEVCVCQSPLHPSCTSLPSQPKCGGIFGSAQLCSHTGPHAHSSPTCLTVLQVASTCNRKRETLKPKKNPGKKYRHFNLRDYLCLKKFKKCQRRTC